jgi:hypothetical protein
MKLNIGKRRDVTFTKKTSGFSGLVVSMLASGIQVRGFKPGWSRRIFRAKMPSFGKKVKPSVPCRRFAACKRSLHLPWKSHAVGKIGSAISRPYFLPSLIEVSHVAGRRAPLGMTGETKSGAQRVRSYGLGASGLQGPGSALYSTTTTTLPGKQILLNIYTNPVTFVILTEAIKSLEIITDSK